jgi:hypothetical protein
VPPDDAYLLALGRAIWAVNRLEWVVIEVTGRLDQSHDFGAIADETTGGVSFKFKAAVAGAGLTDGALASELSELADQFAKLATERNDVAHARPQKTDDGRERLYRWSVRHDVGRFIEDADLHELETRAYDIRRRLSPLRPKLPRFPHEAST